MSESCTADAKAMQSSGGWWWATINNEAGRVAVAYGDTATKAIGRAKVIAKALSE